MLILGSSPRCVRLWLFTSKLNFFLKQTSKSSDRFFSSVSLLFVSQLEPEPVGADVSKSDECRSEHRRLFPDTLKIPNLTVAGVTRGCGLEGAFMFDSLKEEDPLRPAGRAPRPPAAPPARGCRLASA